MGSAVSNTKNVVSDINNTLNFDFKDSINTALTNKSISPDTAKYANTYDNLNWMGAGFTAFGSAMKGVADANSSLALAENRAAFYRQRAQSARLKGFLATSKKSREATKALGGFIVNRGASGTAMTGSALDVYLEGVRQTGTEIIATQAEADNSAILNEFIAENYEYQGQVAALSAAEKGFGGVTTSLLGGKYNEYNLFNKLTR